MTSNRRLIFIFIGIALVLMVPLVGMQLSDQVNWSLFDFMVASVLLGGTGLIAELILRKVKSKKNRLLLLLFLFMALLIVWAELAVGVFGSPWAGS